MPADVCGVYGDTGSVVLGASAATNPIAARMLERRARRNISAARCGKESDNGTLLGSSEDVEITDGLGIHSNSDTLREQPAQSEDTRKMCPKRLPLQGESTANFSSLSSSTHFCGIALLVELVTLLCYGVSANKLDCILDVVFCVFNVQRV